MDGAFAAGRRLTRGPAQFRLLPFDHRWTKKRLEEGSQAFGFGDVHDVWLPQEPGHRSRRGRREGPKFTGCKRTRYL